MMAQPFSFKEVQEATVNFTPTKPQFLSASDGVDLAYYEFFPEIPPKAVVIFYHGGGAWSMPMYQFMAQETARQGMGVYLFDIRGHGHSGGPRGDAKSTQQVWDDIDAALDFVKTKHQKIPLLLAGHSSGAGLILNYASKTNNQHIAGYAFFAPFLASDADTNIEHTDPTRKFVTHVKVWALIAHALTGGWLFAHTPAVFFNYAGITDTDSLIVNAYTCAMASAVFPRNAQGILSKIVQPCALFIGENDEQFDPTKVIAFKKFLQAKQSFSRIIPDTNHLGIVLKAPALFQEMCQKIIASDNA